MTTRIEVLTFILESETKITLLIDETYKYVYTKQGPSRTYFEISKNEKILESKEVNIDFVELVWNTWRSHISNQDNEIDTLNFEFKLKENNAFPQSFVTSLPSEEISVKSLNFRGKLNTRVVVPVIRHIKPSIEHLYIFQIGFPFNLSTFLANSPHFINARIFYSTIPMKKEQILALKGEDISTDPLYLNQCFVAEIITKSLNTGNPKRFRVFRGGRNPKGVLSQFPEALKWTEELEKQYKHKSNPEYDNYMFSLPTSSRKVFVEFRNGRQDVFGFILS